MKKAKYIIYTDCVQYESNSRNARKHLYETNACLVVVCKNDEEETVISRAVRHASGMVLVGASK